MKDRERPRSKLARCPIRPRPVLPTRPDVLPLHNVNSCRSFGTLASIGTSVPPKPLKPAPPEIEVFRRAMRPHENLAISKLISHRKRRASRRLCRTNSQRNWWSQTGSNRRPHACKARALPTELWPLSFLKKGPRISSGARCACGLRPVRVHLAHVSFWPMSHFVNEPAEGGKAKGRRARLRVSRAAHEP